MKTIILTLTFALTTMFSIAQTSEHLTFKGVQIDGKLDEYIIKMKQSGFTVVGAEKGMALLNGDFAGYKDCKVGVTTLKEKDLLWETVCEYMTNYTYQATNIDRYKVWL